MPYPKSKQKEYQYFYGQKLKLQLLSILGSKCIKCENIDKRILTVNHLNGNGKLDRLYSKKKIDSGNLSGLETRCYNCNILYEYERGRLKVDSTRSWSYKRKLCEILGNKCVRCGITDIRILTINHLDGNGKAHKEKLGRGYMFYQKLIENPEERKRVELRCMNCNILYEYERGRLVEYTSSSYVCHSTLRTLNRLMWGRFCKREECDNIILVRDRTAKYCSMDCYKKNASIENSEMWERVHKVK